MTTEFILPTSPADLKALQDAIEEGSNSFAREVAEKSLRKEIAADLKEKIAIPPKIFNKMVKTYYKSSFQDDVKEAEDFQTIYEKVMSGKDFTVDQE
jgi:hypothetical protein